MRLKCNSMTDEKSFPRPISRNKLMVIVISIKLVGGDQFQCQRAIHSIARAVAISSFQQHRETQLSPIIATYRSYVKVKGCMIVPSKTMTDNWSTHNWHGVAPYAIPVPPRAMHINAQCPATIGVAGIALKIIDRECKQQPVGRSFWYKWRQAMRAQKSVHNVRRTDRRDRGLICNAYENRWPQ